MNRVLGIGPSVVRAVYPLGQEAVQDYDIEKVSAAYAGSDRP